jgi:hypothetical protein
MFKRTAVPPVGPSEHQARQPLNMPLELIVRNLAGLCLLFTTLCLSSCASIRVVGEPQRNDATVILTRDDGTLQVDVYRVRSWFTLSYPWEHELGEELPKKLFLSPGKYTFELLCDAGWVYVDWTPEFVVSLKARETYILGCNPKDHKENFFITRVSSN